MLRILLLALALALLPAGAWADAPLPTPTEKGEAMAPCLGTGNVTVYTLDPQYNGDAALVLTPLGGFRIRHMTTSEIDGSRHDALILEVPDPGAFAAPDDPFRAVIQSCF
jgi:hypothetical protein